MLDIIWAIGVNNSLKLRSYLIIVIFYVFGYTFNFDLTENSGVIKQSCFTDEYFNNYSSENISQIIGRRENVRSEMGTKVSRSPQDTISIPVVFHDIYRPIEDEVSKSFCNYSGGFNSEFNYNEVANESCQNRGQKALNILNEQFAPAKIKFIPNPDSLLIIAHTDDDYNSIIMGAGGNVESIRHHYFIPNSLNIYMNYCILDTANVCSSISGMSTYPWGLDSNTPGITIRHSSFPGMNIDLDYNNSIAIFPHELGHYFSLFHIEGIWMFNEDFKREFVNREECEIRGDLICDTPGQPGYSIGAFNTELFGGNRNCIFHGYGGDFNPDNNNLKISGSENSVEIGNIIYSNQDGHGDFWGTYELADSCFLMNQNEFTTDCPLSSYPNLPMSHNFLQPVVVSQYCGGVGYHEYNSINGYSTEQYANIRYSVEHDYTGCNIADACNFDTTSVHLLRFGGSSCYYGSNSSLDANDCFVEGECVYDCIGNELSLNKNIGPRNFEINQIYPNPFNPNAHISYSILYNTEITISVIDLTGRNVETIFEGYQNLGQYNRKWEAHDYPSGIYFINISASNYSVTQKIVLIK